MNKHRMDYIATGDESSLVKSMDPAFWKTVGKMIGEVRWNSFGAKYLKNAERLGINPEDSIQFINKVSWIVRNQVSDTRIERNDYKSYPKAFDRNRHHKHCLGALAWARQRGYLDSSTNWYVLVDAVCFEFNLGKGYLTIGVNGFTHGKFDLRVLCVKDGQLHVLRVLAVSKRSHFEIIESTDHFRYY